MTSKLFSELGLSPELLKAVDKLGYRAEGGSAQRLLDLVKAERAFFTEAAKISNYEPH